jgi:hypothetical protein
MEMSRRIPDDSLSATKRKQAKMERLVERYEGKRALLATWEQSELLDPDYRNDLKKRVNSHKCDIIYRGGEP